MDSPERDDSAEPSLPPPSSPSVQESPFYNYLINLSPIKSTKASRYTPRYRENSLHIPPPVFTSPRLDLQRETGFLQRDDKDAVQVTDGLGHTHLNVFTNSSVVNDVYSCSSLDHIDEYLGKTLELEDNTKSSCSRVISFTEIPQLVHNDFTFSRGTSPRTKAVDAVVENMKTANMPLPDVSDNVGNYRSVESLLLVEPITGHGVNVRLNESTGIVAESNINPHLVSAAPRVEFVENADVQYHNLDISSQKLHECFLFVKTYEDSDSSSRKFSDELNKILSEEQCDSRRHSHYQIQGTMNSNNIGSHVCNFVYPRLQDSENSIQPTIRTNSNPVLSHVETTAMTDNRVQAIASGSSLYLTDCDLVDSTQNLLNSSTLPTPCGSNSMRRRRSTDEKLISHSNSEEGKLGPDSKECPEKNATTSLLSASSEKIYSSDNGHQECQVIEQQEAPCEGETPASRGSSNQVSPRRKRKKSAHTSENEGCKGCHCKKSKCLKLYCECFAAQVYCMKSCACKTCSNKPDNADTVTETRKKIELHNPLAFAPKVVGQTSDSPARVMEEGNVTTPSSARHKKGCSCKKSMCLKKYCECYQAKVGCSNRCHCDHCHNSFGTKAAYGRAEQWEKPSIGKNAGESSSKNTESCSANDLSSTSEAFKDISNLTPTSRTPEAVASDLTGFPNTLKAGFPSSVSGGLQRCSFPENLSPQQYQSNEVLYNPYSNGLLRDAMENRIFNHTTPTKTLVVTSPKQKQASPSHFQSQRLQSNSYPDFGGGHRFSRPTVPTFPPLTPYKNSTDRLTQIEGDNKNHTRHQ